MDRLAKKLTYYIILRNIISKDDYKVYKYGMQTGLEMILCMSICTISAIYMKSFFEYLMIICIFFLLRSFVGGIHLRHFKSCLLCSFIVINSILILPKFYVPHKSVSLVFIFICLLLIILFTPETIKNSVRDREEWIYLKKQRIKISRNLLLLGLVFWSFDLSKLLSLLLYTTIAICISMVVEIIKNRFLKYLR